MEKKCNICNSIKEINEFYKNQIRCKLCININRYY